VTTALSPVIASRLEKAAVDNGFDQELPRDGDWLGFASTQCPLRIWLTAIADDHFVLALSQQHVSAALGEFGTPESISLPEGAESARSVVDIPTLHRLVRRAFQLSRTFPNELLHVFERKTTVLPTTTEAERLVVQRVGQDIFRAGLIDYWEGRCAITGLAVPELLRASHIKPWADCQSNAERLDVFNGILLAPHFDAVFDRGFITLADDGEVIISAVLAAEDRQVLGLHHPLRATGLADRHRHYLPWHRDKVFRGDNAAS
jgi:putative restriction endonuclease